MARNKTAQGGISLRRKVTAWLAAILLVTMLSTGIATMAGQWTVRSFDTLLADNAVCYTVQNALKDETQAFARYVRQPTSETEQAYTAACTASEQSLAALPFDYARIGEERYARTWNLLQGYAGYRQERDAFLQLSPSADTYIEQMYHVMALQDYLAAYALRLTQATLEQENTLYSSTAAHIRHLPWLYLGLARRCRENAHLQPLLTVEQPIQFVEVNEGDATAGKMQVVAQVQEYVKNHLSEKLTLADVAAVFNFSPNYLSQLFGKYGDSGFVEYITETRIAAAKEMLEQGDLKVYEIAEKLGYESAFYFSKVFKKVTGLSPREYQQSI